MAIWVFLAFAAAYFLSALLRAITATLAPTLSDELSLQARDLGLLAGGYFLGFAATQLPLGRWLDRHGPKKVILVFLSVAVLGCAAFAWATSFNGLLAARVLIGAGVSACLMAPLTGYRRWLSAGMQLRANSWMLMTGSLGMVAATLPVQWLMPYVGWRGLFWLLALGIVLCMVFLAWLVPAWSGGPGASATAGSEGAGRGYADVWRHPYFRKMALIGFFNYGGMVAIQTLWAGPWLVRVVGQTPFESATGLFWINLSMLCTFWTWGLVTPGLARRGVPVERLIAWGMPLSLAVLAFNIWQGAETTWVHWALFCILSTCGSLSQPAVAMAFPASMAGRALSAYNLVIFAGIFVVQWGIGLLADGFEALGWSAPDALRASMGVFLGVCVLSYATFLSVKAHNRPS
ncbi:MFS transporter [Tepidicella baoligensis]|uniref:MFS transporter n=1 Tax=Tepidicella baoligensis TaxID=2707016 RepID=UPI0015D9C7CC|nr:MFS transporter [Tepidicella baoligensis]